MLGIAAKKEQCVTFCLINIVRIYNFEIIFIPFDLSYYNEADYVNFIHKFYISCRL